MSANWDLDSHDGLKYRFHLPAGYDPARVKYPLVISLHGSRERGDDTTSHLVNGVDELAKWPVIAVAPQCPSDDTFGGSWYGGETVTQRKVVALARELGTRRSVDPNRISLIGYSMGGIGIWDMIARYPGIFAAAVPIAGDLNPESARSLVDFPIWAFHGERDKSVRNENTRRVNALMRQLGGGKFRYTELPGVGHDSWKAAFTEPELLPWLLAQRRLTS